MQKNKITTKQIVIAALLTALSIIIPMFPFKLPLPEPFSVTFAAHVPTIMAIFISPWVAICTVIGSTIGFFMSTPLIVPIRAASHIIFVLVSVYLLKKKWNGYLVLLIAALLHGAGEAIVVWLIYPIINPAFVPTLSYLVGTVFGITIFHHAVDCAIAIALMYALNASKVFRVDTSSLGFKH